LWLYNYYIETCNLKNFRSIMRRDFVCYMVKLEKKNHARICRCVSLLDVGFPQLCRKSFMDSYQFNFVTNGFASLRVPLLLSMSWEFLWSLCPISCESSLLQFVLHLYSRSVAQKISSSRIKHGRNPISFRK